MRPTSKSFLVPPAVNLSLWFALSSALVAFAIISQDLLFTLSIAAASIFLRCLSPSLSPRIHYATRFVFTVSTYLAAILPLWPESLTDYYAAPLLVAIAIPLLAALNQKSEGGSRGFTSIAAVAFVLFIRNIVLYYDFEAPIQDLSRSIAFIALLEIALSSRYQKGEDSPQPELIFGLLLALIASFHLESLPLALLLTVFPLAAFLLRNYQFAKIANEHVRPTQIISHCPTSTHNTLQLVLFTLIPAALLLYLLTLRVPFWVDFVPQHAPYLAKQIAKKANVIAEAADLENDSLESFAETLINRDFIAEKSSQLIKSFKADPAEEIISPSKPGPQNRETNETQTTNYNHKPQVPSNSLPPTTSRPKLPNPAPPQSTETSETTTVTTFIENVAIPKHASVAPPRTSLEAGIPPNLLPGDELSSAESATTQQSPPESNLLDDISQYLSPQKSKTEAADFDRFLSTFDQPQQAIAQALNLQGSDVSALLDDKPLVIVTLESTRNAPQRLYLRSNVLETISSNGVNATRDEEERIEISATNNALLELPNFRQSKSDGETITITSSQNSSPTLPLPESLSHIEIFGTNTIQVYPNERVALLPFSQEPITYRVYDADLEVTERERAKVELNEDYRQRMLDVPLRKADRNSLTSLAKRIGGNRTSSQSFAERVSKYFEKKHPYSYFVEIPDGPGHAVVRWLENESPGLCSNYAAAFTLLARSRGIPARVVSGFASDEYAPSNKRYTFRQSNAHAWVEYLDESNVWVHFDPTPNISESERRRAEPYATAPQPDSLDQLIQSEQKSLAQQIRTELQKGDLSQIAAIPSTPTPEPNQSTTTSSPLSTSLPYIPDNSPYPLNKPTTTPQPNPATSKPVAETQAVSPQTYAQETTSSKPDPNPFPEVEPLSPKAPIRPPWLLLLSILALGIPAAFYLLHRLSTKKTTPPQLRLRLKAGRLLSQLDTLIQHHDLQNDPVWNETRQTLSAQRYGRETNSILIQDLAVKIALLAKKR